jgi:two-component system sensor histidine kinase BaeS
VPADVDERRIRQVIGNLVTNALRHTPQGGEVAVAVIATAGCAEVRVSDTGEGIPAEHLPHVFDRFYRADPSRSRDTGGSGLGLAIARELVTGHGGTIDVASVEGEGTVFSVRLPAATPSA